MLQHILAELIILHRRLLDHLEVPRSKIQPAAATPAILGGGGGPTLVIDEVLVPRQRRRDLERVADLAAVPSAVGLERAAEVVVMLLGKVDNAAFFDDHLGLVGDGEALVFDGLEAVDVHLEDDFGVFFGKMRVEGRDVDAGLDGVVQCAGAVGGEMTT